MDSIYNNIESFLNDATIDKILKIYEDSNNFYYYGTISNGSKNREEYTNEYNKYVIYENVTRIINNLKNQNVDEYNNKFLKRKQIGINKENGEEAKKQISKKFDILYFYPLENYAGLMNKYTPDEIINLYLKYEKENQKNLYYGEVEEFVADSDEKIAFKFISKILFRIYEREDGIMGMYVNPAFLCQQNEYSIEQYKPEIKLYINANKDTYHFSKLFSDECIKKDICYNYKVAMPNHELSRIERMCIYSTIENLPKYIEILQKIISEHPEFEYGDLPLFAGKINGVIGVGVDPKETSYNQQISEILRNTCNEFFNCTSLFDKNREQAKNLSGARKEEFKQFLIEKIASAGMDPQKLCITNDVAELLKQIKMPKLDINSINTKK